MHEQRAIPARTGKKPRLKRGPPHPKSRGQEGGLRSPDVKSIAFDAVNGRVKIRKFGWLRVRQSRKKLARVHQRIVNERSDWPHKLTTELADRQNILAAGHAAWTLSREQSRAAPDACGDVVGPSRKRRHTPANQEPTEGAGVVA